MTAGEGEPGPFEYLELADYLLIAEAVIGVDAAVLARMPRVVSQAESALAAPRAGFGGVDQYPDLATKAAILCSRLARNHPLPDGNKRSAYLAMVEFIERNGRTFSMPESADPAEDIAATIEAVAASEMEEPDFSAWVRGLVA